MGKIITFLKYTIDFVKHGEFRYILSSIRYIVTGETTRKTRYYRSSLGRFIVRKGSLDFQFANYAYEWNVKKFVYAHYKDYNKLLDIGANIGTYSIILAKKGFNCLAFEPVKSNIDALNTNIELNNLQDSIKVFPFALGAKPDTVSFTFDPVNTGASHLSAYAELDFEIKHPVKEEIEVKKLDDIIPELNILSDDKLLIKIDVEGMEAEVIDGATNFLKSHKDLLIVMETVHSGVDALKEKLNKIGTFEYHIIDDLNMAAVKLK